MFWCLFYYWETGEGGCLEKGAVVVGLESWSDVPVLAVYVVCEWVGGWWSGRGWSLVSPYWLCEWCLSVWRD